MRIEQNNKGQDYVVGDIHGHWDLLFNKLKEIGFDKKTDRLFSVGDLIDRGPNSLDCLSLIFEPWFFSVRGNHEQMMFDSLQGSDPQTTQLWMMNGGSWIVNSDIEFVREVSKQAEEKMPVWMEVETVSGLIGIVHAEPPIYWSQIEEANIQDLIWSRHKIKHMDGSLIHDIHKVYVGHTPMNEPETLGNTHYIDTGAFHTGTLTIEKM